MNARHLYQFAYRLVYRLLPGTVFLLIVTLARLMGWLQPLELRALDGFLRNRPAEPLDERIVIVAIDKEGIEQLGSYPIPLQRVSELLQTLLAYRPVAVGLDLFPSDVQVPAQPLGSPVVPQSGLDNGKTGENIVTVERAIPPIIEPLPLSGHELTGFSDVILDRDNHIRRALLGTPPVVQNEDDPSEPYKFSLAIRLSQLCLQSQQITLESGNRDRAAMRFGHQELPRFQVHSGGYQLTNPEEAGGVQILLNFRSGRRPFRIVSPGDILTGQVDPNWLRDRLVIVGITDPRYKNTLQTMAIPGMNPEPGLVDGIEVQAHAVSQILSAVLDGRPLIRTWPEAWEYGAIAATGFLGIVVGKRSRGQIKPLLINLAGIIVFNVGVWGLAYLSLLSIGWWLPVVPTLLVFNLNSLGLSLFSFYQYNQDLKSRINEREHIIEHTFNVIHNGPLQRLATILRGVRDRELAPEILLHELDTLNRELRQLSKELEQDLLNQEEGVRLGNGQLLDLKLPIHDLLYQVYSNTLERDLPAFTTLNVKVRTFAPIEERCLKLEQKRGLCQFLEEALCNAGKHAIGATRLEATGQIDYPKSGWYTLQVIDNGPGLKASHEGQGTKQSLKLKAQLQGKFKREPRQPKGTCCQLSWPLEKKSLW